jgi:4-amino-4-deoxy-L-arabinose transferase-like glycosyltransferase
MPILTVDRRSGPWSRLTLVGILLISGFLHLFHRNQVGFNGFGNPYYAAGVQSMLTGWRPFFYLAFAPAAFPALDKAPLERWFQAASARLFGFQALSYVSVRSVGVSAYLRLLLMLESTNRLVRLKGFCTLCP